MLSLGLVGCQARVTHVAGNTAMYAGRTLTTTLPDDVRVPAVLAAADATMRARGYTVRHRRDTMDNGFVVAVPPERSLGEKVTVHASIARGGTFVQITADPFGNHALSAAILDAVLQRLGL